MRALGILLIVVAIALGVAGMVLARRPVLYSSTAIVKVARDKIDLPELSGIANLTATATGAGNTVFIETEVALINSDATVSQVITQLNLSEAWGQRFNGGNALEPAEASQLLKQRLQAQPGVDSGVIQIKAFSEVANEAADIANALAGAYCSYRADYRRRLVQTAMDTIAGKHAEMEKQIAEQQAKVEQAWQRLDPGLQASATTNAASADSEILRNLHRKLSEALLRYLAASNQLALFPITNFANDAVIEQLKSRAEKTKAELIATQNATVDETHRAELLTSFQADRQKLDELNQRFTPVRRKMEELRNDLRPQSQPPASVVEQATVARAPDASNASRQPWMLPVAGAALLLGVGLLIVGRSPKKAAT